MALTCIGKGENARGSDFQCAEGGFGFAFGKQNEIENSGGAHEQSCPQRRLLSDAEKVSEIAGIALGRHDAEESDAGGNPTEPVEGFAENPAQSSIRGRVEDFAAGCSGLVCEFLEVAGDAGNDGFIPFKGAEDAPFAGIQASGEFGVCFAQNCGSQGNHLWAECFQIGERQAGVFNGVAIGSGALQI